MMKGAYPSYGTAVPETGDVHLITLADRRTSSCTTSFFSSSRDKASRSGGGSTDMTLDNHVDPHQGKPSRQVATPTNRGN